MMEGLSKLVLAGLGAMTMTRERAEKIFDECLERGHVENKNRSRFVQDLLDATEKARKDTEQFLSDRLASLLAEMNLPTRDDLARLEEKVDRLCGKD